MCTGIGYARDFVIASSGDAIIATGGGVRILIELGVGYMAKKTVVAIAGSGMADMCGGKFLDEINRVPMTAARTQKRQSPPYWL
jgi:hypothetical protein